MQRWSRRKLSPESGGAPSAPEADAATGQSDDAFAEFDYESLDFASDYRRFMDAAVPDHVRTKALQRLWNSSDIISCPDNLDDFLEDFREEAKALPSGLARSAYQIGRGFSPARENDAPEAPNERREGGASDELYEAQPCEPRISSELSDDTVREADLNDADVADNAPITSRQHPKPPEGEG